MGCPGNFFLVYTCLIKLEEMTFVRLADILLEDFGADVLGRVRFEWWDVERLSTEDVVGCICWVAVA